jgi:hypothetical protein
LICAFLPDLLAVASGEGGEEALGVGEVGQDRVRAGGG